MAIWREEQKNIKVMNKSKLEVKNRKTNLCMDTKNKKHETRNKKQETRAINKK